MLKSLPLMTESLPPPMPKKTSTKEPLTRPNKEMTEEANATKLLMITKKEELEETQTEKLFLN